MTIENSQKILASKNGWILLSPRLKMVIVEWLNDKLGIEIDEEDVKKIERLDELIAFMLEDYDDLVFEWRIRDPVFAMGRNLQHAYENFEPDIYDDDEVIFTGHWQAV